MYGVPELKELDEIHDDLIINAMARMFERLDIASKEAELKRLGRCYPRNYPCIGAGCGESE